MKHDGFEVEVKTRVSLTIEEIDVVKKVCLEHYDRACKLAGSDGPEGFVNHMTEFVVPGSRSILHRATFREIDTIAKALEQAGIVFINDPKSLAIARAVQKTCSEILKGINAAWSKAHEAVGNCDHVWTDDGNDGDNKQTCSKCKIKRFD